MPIFATLNSKQDYGNETTKDHKGDERNVKRH